LGGGGLRGLGGLADAKVADTRPNKPADPTIDQFEFKLSLVPPQHRAAIEALAGRIIAAAVHVKGPLGRVELFGHADFIGEPSYNNPLGLLRAKAVRGALVAALEKRMRGVTSRIEIDAFSLGEDYPVDSSDRSDEGRARSRRVQVYAMLVPWVPFPWEYNKDPGPGRWKGPPNQPESETDIILRTKVPPPPRKCVKVYDKVVAFLRRKLDQLLDVSPIPRRYHKKVKALAEQWAADRRDEVIDKGLDELGLEGQLKVAARKLVLYAIQKACI